MKVSEHSEFNPEYPEKYTWGRIDKITYSNLGSLLSNWIEHDIKTIDRNLVPGLRKALNLIAEKADI